MTAISPVRSVYHITTRGQWDAARQAGRYSADSLEREGFIHCSTRDQVLGTAERYYAGQTGLVLLEIDCERLAAPLRFEDTYGHGTAYPHLYGLLNLDAVTRVLQFEPDPLTGAFSWPFIALSDERS